AQDWWRSFGSAELDALVEQARRHSLDVAAAAARVRQAEAVARQAGAALVPVVAASLQSSREGRAGGHAAVAGNHHGAQLWASYEVDFWGRNRAAREAARADWQASTFDRDTVQLTVAAGVASTWLLAVALHERGAIAESNLGSAERLLHWMEARSRAGAATALELAQQRGLVASQCRAVAALRQQAGEARAALALLLGQPAPALAVGPATWAGVQEPRVGAGWPTRRLVQRPDIARAEAQLAAADAQVAVARAAMLPSLTLTAGLGTGGERLSRLLDNPLYSLAAGLAAPVFDAGRLAAGTDLARARREELLAGYRQHIVAAFADVEVALDAAARLAEQSAAQDQELQQAQRALALAESRYRAGAETLLTLLDAQRTLYAAQDMAVQLRLARLQASVSLYRAFGGGWSPSVTTY
ncbi:efflux transporter outer membrane subunit, partial [Azohydromonas lata]